MRPTRLSLLLIALLTLVTSAALAQAPITPPPLRDLALKIEAALDAPDLRPSSQGILIQSLTEGSTLFERNPDRVFLPASNNKLLTAGAALALLGEGFRYRTIVYRIGELSEDGTLQGDLILVGEGDPTLSPTQLKQLAQEVRQAGIKRIMGHVGFDDSRFDRQHLGLGWNWDDESFNYSAPVSALNVNKNLINAQPRPGTQPGTPVKFVLGPTQGYVTVKNTARYSARGTKRTLDIRRVHTQNILEITGSLPIDTPLNEIKPVGLTIENPSHYVAYVFADYLRRAGIPVVKPQIMDFSRFQFRTREKVAQAISDPLPDLLKYLNKPSDNLIAECLIKTLGAKKSPNGRGGSWDEGILAAREWFVKIGLDVKCVQMADGSGLSRQNFVSPRNLAKLLAHFAASKQNDAFYNSLPIAGVDGTLQNRMKGTPAENNCRAKTGTLSHASSLSGYVTTKDGERLVFSILINNYLTTGSAAREAQDTIVALLANFSRKSP